jgi:hypothetical protein
MDQYLAEITRVVRNADESFQKSGGSSRHWVRDNFFPELKAGGFTITKTEAPRPEHGTPEENWDNFWKDIVTNPDGTVNLEQVKKELSDFLFVMGEVPKVYCHITGDRMSKIMYHADAVITQADDYEQERWEKQQDEIKASGMRCCYIAHPISGDIETNLADLRRIIRKINMEHPDVVAFAPYYADVVSLDDNIPAERARGIANNVAILRSGIVQELWLTGPRISTGMQHEKELAEELGIPVVNMIGCL